MWTNLAEENLTIINGKGEGGCKKIQKFVEFRWFYLAQRKVNLYSGRHMKNQPFPTLENIKV